MGSSSALLTVLNCFCRSDSPVHVVLLFVHDILGLRVRPLVPCIISFSGLLLSVLTVPNVRFCRLWCRIDVYLLNSLFIFIQPNSELRSSTSYSCVVYRPLNTVQQYTSHQSWFPLVFDVMTSVSISKSRQQFQHKRHIPFYAGRPCYTQSSAEAWPYGPLRCRGGTEGCVSGVVSRVCATWWTSSPDV